MSVFLRPQPAATPIDYQREVGMSGLVVLPRRQLAIYTFKSVPKEGQQGVPGIDKNSWYDTIIAAASDEVSPIDVGGPKVTFRCPYALDLTTGYIRCSLATAPTGAAVIIDVKMNGVTVFTTPLYIDIGTKTSVGSVTTAVLSTTYFPDDAELQVFVNQIGSTIAGAGLKVAITGIKTT